MKFIRHRNIIKLLLSLQFSWMSIFFSYAQEKFIIDEIITKVDNYIILKSDVEIGYQQMLSSGHSLSENSKCEILRGLIINKILVAKADIDSIVVSPDIVEEELNRRMDYFVTQAGGRDKLEKTLGKSITQLKESLYNQIREQMLIQQVRQKVMEDISVTPGEVKKYFNSLDKDSIPFLSAEVQVGQIVKHVQVNKGRKNEVRRKLFDIKQRIIEGENFALLAHKYSEDFGSRSKGGDLGWAGRGIMVPEFEATALRIGKNEISDPIETEFGYHIIQLLERKGNRFHARHILIRPKPDENDINRAKIFLDSVKNLILADSFTFEQAAKMFSDDSRTRANSSYFQDPNSGSSMVATDRLDPVVFFTIDTMQLNDITAPLSFRTEDSKQAVRIIYYKNYIPPHYANLKDDYQKIYSAALEEKHFSILENWIEKAKREVFIDINSQYSNCKILEDL